MQLTSSACFLRHNDILVDTNNVADNLKPCLDCDIMAQIIWSRERPVKFLLGNPQDSTGRPLEFCKFVSNVIESPISSTNTIKISSGRPVVRISIGRTVEFLEDVQ